MKESADDDPISVADSNLFAAAVTRRYLFGLAALRGQPLAVPQALVQPQEMPGNIARSFINAVSRRRAGRDRTRAERREMENRIAESVNLAVADAVRSWIETGAIRVLPASNEADRLTISIMARSGAASTDAMLVAQTVAAGGTMVATSNAKSLDHDEVNLWWSERTGANRKLLVKVPELSEELTADAWMEAALLVIVTADGRADAESMLRAARRIPGALSRATGCEALYRRVATIVEDDDALEALFEDAARLAEREPVRRSCEREVRLRQVIGRTVDQASRPA